jgi:hypothetical protein
MHLTLCDVLDEAQGTRSCPDGEVQSESEMGAGKGGAAAGDRKVHAEHMHVHAGGAAGVPLRCVGVLHYISDHPSPTMSPQLALAGHGRALVLAVEDALPGRDASAGEDGAYRV